MMSYKEIYEITNKFWEHLVRQGYAESYARQIVMGARRLLREFGDINKVDENAIWQRYMYHSKRYRNMLVSSYRLFKKFLEEEGRNG